MHFRIKLIWIYSHLMIKQKKMIRNKPVKQKTVVIQVME